jgi:hypothetical protein
MYYYPFMTSGQEGHERTIVFLKHLAVICLLYSVVLRRAIAGYPDPGAASTSHGITTHAREHEAGHGDRQLRFEKVHDALTARVNNLRSPLIS